MVGLFDVPPPPLPPPAPPLPQPANSTAAQPTTNATLTRIRHLARCKYLQGELVVPGYHPCRECATALFCLHLGLWAGRCLQPTQPAALHAPLAHPKTGAAKERIFILPRPALLDKYKGTSADHTPVAPAPARIAYRNPCASRWLQPTARWSAPSAP